MTVQATFALLSFFVLLPPLTKQSYQFVPHSCYLLEQTASNANTDQPLIRINLESLVSEVSSQTNPFASEGQAAEGSYDSVVGNIVGTLAHELGHWGDSSNPIFNLHTSPQNQVYLAASELLSEGRAAYNNIIVGSEISSSSNGANQIREDVSDNEVLTASQQTQQVAAPVLGSEYALFNPSSESSVPSNQNYLEAEWSAFAPPLSDFTEVVFTNKIADGKTTISELQENLSNITGSDIVTLTAKSDGTPQGLVLQHSDGTTSTIVFTSDGTTDTIAGDVDESGTKSVQTIYDLSATYYTDEIYNTTPGESDVAYGNVTVTTSGTSTVEEFNTDGTVLSQISITAPSDRLSGFSDQDGGTLVTQFSSATGAIVGNITTIGGLEDMALSNVSATLGNNTSASVTGTGNTITLSFDNNLSLTSANNGLVIGSEIFDPNTYSAKNAISLEGNVLSITLATADGQALGQLSLNESTDNGTVTLTDGEIFDVTTTGGHIAAVSATSSSPQVLSDYLSDLGGAQTPSSLDTANYAYLYPSGLPSQGTTLNLSSHSGVVNQSEFNAFTSISGNGVITAATSGTFDLATSNVTSGTQSLKATDWGGTTLIGNSENSQELTASLFGNDTLTAGNGTGDFLVAGSGVDTLTGGTGHDTFEALNGLADGSTLTGNGTSNTLVATGDLSQATITGMQTLQIDSDVTLTAGQFNEFGTVITNTGSGGTVYTTGGGTYNLTGKTLEPSLTIDVATDDDTTVSGSPTITDSGSITLIASGDGNDTLSAGGAQGDTVSATGDGNDTLTSGDGDYDALTATGDGNDTLTAGGGDYDTLTATGYGSSTLTSGDGDYDTLTASNGTDELIAGNGNGDTVSVTTGGNTLETGSGTGDILTAQGGDNILTGGNGGDTFNLYDDYNTATGGTGNDTFNLMGPSALAGDLSGTTLTLTSSIAGGGGTDTIVTSAQGLDISQAAVTGISVLDGTGMDALTLTAAEMGELTSLAFGGTGADTLTAATAGTYNLGAVDSADRVIMTATASGTTLIGNDATGETLESANDNLELCLRPAA